MLDFNNNQHRIEIVDQEDRAMLRSNPSAWSMPEDGQEHVSTHMLLPSRSSFGYKAINLLSWCFAPTKALRSSITAPVRHMSAYIILCSKNRGTPKKAYHPISCLLTPDFHTPVQKSHIRTKGRKNSQVYQAGNFRNQSWLKMLKMPRVKPSSWHRVKSSKFASRNSLRVSFELCCYNLP